MRLVADKKVAAYLAFVGYIQVLAVRNLDSGSTHNLLVVVAFGGQE
jgi:hypothetical protein